jgi:hypothetical protein
MKGSVKIRCSCGNYSQTVYKGRFPMCWGCYYNLVGNRTPFEGASFETWHEVNLDNGELLPNNADLIGHTYVVGPRHYEVVSVDALLPNTRVMTRVTGSEGIVHLLSPAHASFVREQLKFKNPAVIGEEDWQRQMAEWDEEHKDDDEKPQPPKWARGSYRPY